MRIRLLLLGAVLCCPAASFAQSYVSQPLASPAGGSGCSAAASSDGGVVVGVCFAPQNRAVVWRDGIPAYLPLPAGFTASAASDVNESGQIVGVCSRLTQSPFQACLWTTSGVQLLQTPADEVSVANEINEAGQIAGYVNLRATIWTNGVPATMPGAEGLVFSSVSAINDLGDAAVSANAGSGDFAMIWTASGATSPLPVPALSTSHFASAINNHGEVAGSARIAGTFHAVRWANGIAQVLPDENQSSGNDIDDNGVVVGASNNQATAWFGSNRLLIAGASSAARDITNAGVIAGHVNGVAHLFVPQGAAVLAAGIALQIDALIVSERLSSTDAAALQTLITAAVARIAAENNTAASNVLGAFNNRVVALVNSGRLSQTDADSLAASSSGLIALLRN